MFLTSFKLQGFKSFKEKTTLDFKNGITTIVGPNGSGKSNIADAFRWVLGEQKIKALRGEKGEDVIFGGTKVHKPLGVASVVMDIDNESRFLNIPYETVSVGRKVYRSGDSEYTINGTKCRLKDIHQLFNDTGLGRNSFSIIGQGEIESILNAKPEERRGIIEELAGIVKYRIRKEESQKKISHAESDLTRIRDIIEELTSNFEYLEEESLRAKEYVALKEEGDQLELNLIVGDLRDFEELLSQVEEKIALLSQEVAFQSSLLATKDAQYEANKMQQISLEENIKFKRQSLTELKDKLAQVNTNLATQTARIEALEDKKVALGKDLTEVLEKKEQFLNIYQDKLFKKEEWSLKIKEKQEALKLVELESQKIISEKTKYLEDAQNIHYEMIDIFQRIAVLHNEITSVDEEELALKRKSENALSSRSELLVEEETFKNSLSLKESEYKQLEELLGVKENELVMKRRLKGELESKKVKAQEEYQTSQTKYQHIYSQVRALKDIQKEYQGYYSGVKNVLLAKEQGKLNGIIGVIGELITVEPEYEKAIEIALGGGMQDLVAKTSQSAKEAIALLKREKSGRSTFLPLDTIKGRFLIRDLEYLTKEPGVLGVAKDLVKIEPSCQKAIDHLLGNILIVKNIDIGMEIAKKSQYRLKIVTLEGEQLNPGGSLTGGNTGKVNSILSRNRKLLELEAELVLKNEERQKLERAQNTLDQELYPLSGKIEADENRLKELQNKGLVAKEELILLREKSKQFKEKLELVLLDKELVQEEILGLSKERELLEKRLKEEEALKLQRDEEKKSFEKSASELDLKIEELGQEARSIALDKATLEERENALKESLAAFYGEETSLKDLISKKEETLRQVERELGEILDSQLASKESKGEADLHVETLALEVDNLDKSKEELFLETMALEKELKIVSGELKLKENLLHEEEIKKAKKDTEKENKLSILQEKFELLLSEALEKATTVLDRGEAQKRLRVINKGIEALGEVNIGSITEFARVEERLTFLVTQEEDINTSIKSLEGIVEEISGIMAQKFKSAFKELNEAFKETFNALFNGGEAFMKLDDQDDLLECGIEIYSKPPGKTPKSLSSLSGGERALTALALLFSLLKIKPSPLCIIDEADASLDEKNVVNFANYLKTYSNKTQFLVISHRQGTIEGSDSLYGVTMDKTGVSKMISVEMS